MNQHPPPVVPLRPNSNPYYNTSTYQPPHNDEPLAAPKPYKVEPDIGINMARQLETEMRRPSLPSAPQHGGGGGFTGGGWRSPPPAAYPNPQPRQQQAGYPGGFATGPPPPSTYPTPGPYPPSGVAQPGYDPISGPMTNLTFGPTPGNLSTGSPRNRIQSMYGPPPLQPQQSQMPAGLGGAGADLTAALPNIQHLTSAIPAIQNPAHDAVLKVTFIKDTLFLVERAHPDAPSGEQLLIQDPALNKLVQAGLPALLTMCNTIHPAPGGILPPWQSEALYLKAGLEASGHYPAFFPHSPRQAFRDFESSARGGFASAWFRLGRDYEQFGDNTRAKDCFERGARGGDGGCSYRLGIAHLLSQLTFANMPANPMEALPFLLQSANQATLHNPQGPYVLALLMMGEFPSLAPNAQLPESIFWNANIVPSNSSLLLETKKWLEKSAYLYFAPAQYKMGHAYEFATPPFTYSPLMSVQYYSLASQAGETEADMALSKWFLCGADEQNGEGGFEKDEGLAWTFADKAAQKGLPSAEFAMGYYSEVGIGGNGQKDLNAAKRWYEKASAHGNPDASARLQALDGASTLTRQEHELITENRLVRKRTQAKERSDAQGYTPPSARPQVGGVIENVRKTSLMMPPQEPTVPPPSTYAPPPSGYAPPPSGYAPPPSGYASPPSGFAPPPSGYVSPPTRYSPSPTPQQGPAYPAGPDVHLRPQKTPAQQNMSQLNRVSLVDGGPTLRPPSSGSGGAPPSGGSGNGSKYGPAGGRPVSAEGSASGGGGGGNDVGSSQPQPPKKPGPATFAEMGFQGVKAEDKECVIM